jgi:hypothetical protein
MLHDNRTAACHHSCGQSSNDTALVLYALSLRVQVLAESVLWTPLVTFTNAVYGVQSL